MRIKDKSFAFRATEKQLEQLKLRALKAKMSTTDYLIACGLCKKIIVIDNLSDLTVELKRIGNNLNQLTTLANMNRINTVNLDATCSELSKIYEAVCQLAKRCS